MTRALAITNMYPPHHYGGYELSCRDVMERFRERGHEVTVLTTDMRVAGVQDPPDERARGVHRDLRFYWRDHQLLGPSPARRLQIERANQRALGALLDSARPEVVSVWNMGAMSFGLLTTLVERKVPMVLNICDEWPYYGPHLDAWARMFRQRPVLGRLIRRLTGVPTLVPDVAAHAACCFVTDAMRSKAITETSWTYPVTSVVYSGIENREFRPAAGAIPTRPWRWRLLFVGRIDERKGIETIIRALPHLPQDATLEVIGQGDDTYLAELHRLMRQTGVEDRVCFSVAPRAELPQRYGAADVFVFPSTWREPFGLVPLEAMACDTPVVATGTGGTGEFLVDGVNAVLFEPGDPVSLAAALRRVADDQELRAGLIAAGRRTAAELTIDRLADTLEEWHVAAACSFANGLPADRPSPAGATGPR